MTVLLVAYPFIVYLGLQFTDLRWVLVALAVILLIRLSALKEADKALRLPVWAGLLLVTLSFVTEQQGFILFYPVMVNLIFLFIFGYSLKSGLPMIERFARIREPELPEEAKPYLYKITQIWCGFFIVNASISMYTAMMTNLKIWSLYNGLISYLLSGSLFVGEWLYRKLCLKR
ncbi:hypothetical protein [Parashewanella curva]|uniref:COG4648 family protein n=1 Tax=Parashewanella curva TaxID=2338552 RepID=UPI001FB4A7AF|nr:hypothetical protein [Parashewanella curva]